MEEVRTRVVSRRRGGGQEGKADELEGNTMLAVVKLLSARG
jgi:hypothetical protein